MSLLTKSRYLKGLESDRFLWFAVNKPELIPKPTLQEEFLFEQGHKVGELAKKLYSEGVDIPTTDFMNNIRRTTFLLNKRKPLFEAGILRNRVYSRIDVLMPVGTSEWDIIEVKSSTKVKPVHIQDVSFQKYCCELANINVRRCFLLYVNSDYVKKDSFNVKDFFTLEDITDRVVKESEGIEERIKKMLKVISLKEPPEFVIDEISKSVYGNFIIDDFFDSLPVNNVFDLCRGGKTSLNLYKSGIKLIKEISPEQKLTNKQKIQYEVERTNERHIEKKKLKSFVNTLKYPLYFLDFETINYSIPLFKNSKPYQQIPFQYSLHKQEENGKVEHYEFLAKNSEDPRPSFISSLKDSLGDTGSIIVYYQSFEKGRLNELAKIYPNYKKWVGEVCDRIIDLYEPFSNFYFYDNKQRGSASLKMVLPAITGNSYEDMAISNGSQAGITFFKEVYEKNTCTHKVFKQLTDYCTLDTEGMIWILDEIKRLIKS